MIGKQNTTLIKSQVKESKLLTVGVKALRLWHEATAGETSIPFASLTMPADISSNGFSNPSGTEILAANLALFHTNVEVFSSLNGKLMEGLTYVVQNAQIKFVNGYTSTAGEIFEVTYKNDVITGNNVVDARPLTKTGVLTAETTDFTVGEAFKTNQYPSDQLGEVLVFLDGVIQYRNVANATAAPAADGNYQEVHATGGFGTIIRFNDTLPDDTPVIVISRNLIAERPDISMMQLIENLGGQLDAVIESVAVLAGVPTSDFQTAANQIDLAAFSDAVIANRNNITSILDVEVMVDGGNHPDFHLNGVKAVAHHLEVLHTFTGLIIGREYVIRGMTYSECTNGSDLAYVTFYNSLDSTIPLGRSGQWIVTTPTTDRRYGYYGVSIKFTAVATNVEIVVSTQGAGQVAGDGTKLLSYWQLERKPKSVKLSTLI